MTVLTTVAKLTLSMLCSAALRINSAGSPFPEQLLPSINWATLIGLLLSKQAAPAKLLTSTTSPAFIARGAPPFTVTEVPFSSARMR